MKYDVVEKVIVILGAMAFVFVASVFGGTIVWLIWPVVAKAFPGLVASGVISSGLSWWDSVCLAWLFGILIKSTQTNKKE